MSDVTQILGQIEDGDPSAAEKLLPLVYEELRRLAASKMMAERPDHTLQATALVHAAYVRLVDVDTIQNWNSRAHFFSAAAEAMRRILIENARRKSGPVAGGDWKRVDISVVSPENPHLEIDLIALHDALQQLEQKAPRKAELVKLRFFAGMTNEEASELLGISARTAYEDWNYAKAWLQVEMGMS